MKEVELMIFDFDGTLVDSGSDLAQAVNHTLRMFGLPECRRETILNFIGDGVSKLIERSLGESNIHLYDKAIRIFTEFYDGHLLDTTHLYPDAADVLDFFSDKKKVILTNKRSIYTERIASALGIARYFDGIFCPDTIPYTKPNPRCVEWILETLRLRCENGKMAMIGDGVNDVLLARGAGIVSCTLVGGYTDRESLAALSPDYCCNSLGEIKGIFV